MQRIIILVGAAATLLTAGASARAQATAPAAEVTRTRVKPAIILDVSLGGGARRISDAGGTESATGLVLGAKIGRRLGSSWGFVAVLEADAMARDDYISYGAWTFGAGLRFEGLPLIVTAGAGLAIGSSQRLAGDYSLDSQSMSGVAAFVHGNLPLVDIGHAQLGITGNLSFKRVSAGTSIAGLSVGAALSW